MPITNIFKQFANKQRFISIKNYGILNYEIIDVRNIAYILRDNKWSTTSIYFKQGERIRLDNFTDEHHKELLSQIDIDE